MVAYFLHVGQVDLLGHLHHLAVRIRSGLYFDKMGSLQNKQVGVVDGFHAHVTGVGGLDAIGIEGVLIDCGYVGVWLDSLEASVSPKVNRGLGTNGCC